MHFIWIFFLFPSLGKSAMQQMQANQSIRMQSSGDNRYHCTKHTNKQKEAEKSNQSQSVKKTIRFFSV